VPKLHPEHQSAPLVPVVTVCVVDVNGFVSDVTDVAVCVVFVMVVVVKAVAVVEVTYVDDVEVTSVLVTVVVFVMLVSVSVADVEVADVLVVVELCVRVTPDGSGGVAVVVEIVDCVVSVVNDVIVDVVQFDSSDPSAQF
jgi:hypothetical protein